MLNLIRSYIILLITAVLALIAFMFNLGPLWVVEMLGFIVIAFWIIAGLACIVTTFYIGRMALRTLKL